jgi:hypothetical protein
MQRHRHQEFLRYLGAIECAIPAGKIIHVVLDNVATHKTPDVLKWLTRHPRWVFHFTPTSGSWLNAVETFFSTLTRRRKVIVAVAEKDRMPVHLTSRPAPLQDRPVAACPVHTPEWRP